MIRWKYALPRLGLAATVLLLVYFGLNPLIRWGLVSFSEQVLSTSVEMGRLNASLRSAELQIDDFAVVAPDNPRMNLVEVDQIKLSLETSALLHRKFVVKEGVIHGLRWKNERSEPAAAIDHWQWNANGERLREASEAWLGKLSATLGEQLESEIDSLVSVQLARELLESWPEEYDQLEARVRDLKTRIEAIRTLFRNQPTDLASGLDQYRRAMSELQQLQQEMINLAEQVDALPDRIDADRETILAATKTDIKTLEKRFQSFRLDEETLTNYLLGEQMGRRVVSIAEWVRWVRSQLPEEELELGERMRGVDMLFAGHRRRPDFLVESLTIDGETQIGGSLYSFVAAAEGLTTEPRLYGRPARIRARLAGEVPVELHAVFDRTGDVPLDEIVIDCPNLSVPEVTLGREEAIAFSLQPGTTHLWISLTLTGDRVSGTMLLQQSDVQLTPTIPESLGGQRLADNLASTVESLDRLEVQVDLAGPVTRPKWVLRSTIGATLADGLNRAALAELEYRRDQAAQLVQQHVDKELSKFRNRLATDEEILKTRLKLSETEIEEIGRLVAQRVPSADKVLTKALGDRLPFRF